MNSFVNSDYQLDLPGNAGFMDLKVPNSWALNFNFAEKSFGLIGNYFGLVTGLGLEYNRYMLSKNVDIAEVDGFMTGVPLDYSLDKNRFSLLYLDVPLMAEIQLPVTGEHKRIHLSGGVIGGMQSAPLQQGAQAVHVHDPENRGWFRDTHSWPPALSICVSSIARDWLP